MHPRKCVPTLILIYFVSDHFAAALAHRVPTIARQNNSAAPGWPSSKGGENPPSVETFPRMSDQLASAFDSRPRPMPAAGYAWRTSSCLWKLCERVELIAKRSFGPHSMGRPYCSRCSCLGRTSRSFYHGSHCRDWPYRYTRFRSRIRSSRPATRYRQWTDYTKLSIHIGWHWMQRSN